MMRTKSRNSNMSQGNFIFSDDPTKMNMLRNSTTILSRLESLESKSMEQQRTIEQQTGTILQLEERMKSLLEEKANLEGLLNQIDEAENHAEFEEYKQKMEQKFKDDLNVTTEELRMRIGELEHLVLKKDIEIEKKTKRVASLEEEVTSKVESIENYEENFVSKIKYQNVTEEANKQKQKAANLESTLTFRDLKISELEAKLVKVEETRKKEAETMKKKAEGRFEDAKKKWEDSKKKFKEQISELTEWKNKNLRGVQVDPEEM